VSRATIREAIRAWLIGAGATAVIFADQGALRPALPYLTVKVRLHDIPHGGDAIHYRDDDTLLALGERRAAVTVQAFGETAIGELEEAVSRLPLPTAQDTLTTAGLTVEPVGGLLDLTRVIDEHPEPRASRDFDVLYQRSSDEVAFVEATTLTTTAEVDDLSTTFTES